MKRKIIGVLLIFSLVLNIWFIKMIKPSSIKTSGKKVNIANLSNYFAGYNGCFVLFDQKRDDYTIYNVVKSQKRVSPCSTFKIFNSLIGLETKLLVDENTTFSWNGTKYPIESWNKDQTLKSAVSNSVVWYFQKLATQVGENKMQNYLNKYNYGNKDISGGITRFWLQSSLKISPLEQVDLLKRFYNYQLPASKRNIDIVKNVITISNAKGIKLYGKTGSGKSPLNNRYINGWFVGFVENNGNVYFFATNIEDNAITNKSADGAEAKVITLKILKDKNIF